MGNPCDNADEKISASGASRKNAVSTSTRVSSVRRTTGPAPTGVSIASLWLLRADMSVTAADVAQMPGLDRIRHDQHDKSHGEHHRGDRRRRAVIVFLE